MSVTKCQFIAKLCLYVNADHMSNFSALSGPPADWTRSPDLVRDGRKFIDRRRRLFWWMEGVERQVVSLYPESAVLDRCGKTEEMEKVNWNAENNITVTGEKSFFPASLLFWCIERAKCKELHSKRSLKGEKQV